MRYNKKGEIEDIVIRIGLVLGILILVFWFIFFIGKQTINTQNLIFDSTNKFAAYYELILNSDESEIKGVEIKSIKDSKLSVKGNKICIFAENTINFCQEIVTSSPYNASFNLSETNYFDFKKDKFGNIIIERTY